MKQVNDRPRVLRIARRLIDWGERYQRWYQNSRWGDWNLPRCPFCLADRKYIKMGPHKMQNYRYQMARTTMLVRCTRCGGTMTATQQRGSKGWTYFDS